MGGGDTTKTETTRRIPRPAAPGDSLAAGGGEGGVPEVMPNFCELKQEIAFEISSSATVTVGLRVRLLPQSLPQVMAGDQTIGFVIEPDATAMRHCLEEDFHVGGWVSALDPGGRTGKLSLKGRKSS